MHNSFWYLFLTDDYVELSCGAECFLLEWNKICVCCKDGLMKLKFCFSE